MHCRHCVTVHHIDGQIAIGNQGYGRTTSGAARFGRHHEPIVADPGEFRGQGKGHHLVDHTEFDASI